MSLRRRRSALCFLLSLLLVWCAGHVVPIAAAVNGGAAVAGQLDLRVSRFTNHGGQVAGGGCCLHPGRPPACTALCRTFFRVCITYAPSSGPASAKLSQGQRGTLKACPLGLLVTRVVANGSLTAGDDGVLDMTFPFTEPWPVDFKLILEAWHDVTGRLFQAPRRRGKEDAGGQLIARHIANHRQEGGRPWSFHAHGNAHTKLHYALKVTCAASHHGPTCSKVCRPGVEGRRCNTTRACKDNCSEELCVPPNNCSCPEGWTGTLCDAPVCAPGCSTEHGYCGTPGECRCEVGWWGERCDLCFPYPGCQHGTCKQPWQCLCEPGWSGDLCDTWETTETSSSGKDATEVVKAEACKCHNGGTCLEAEPPQNYTCSCPALFTGRHCDYLARPARTRSAAARSRASPVLEEVQEKEEEVEEEDPKATRRRLLQKYARISFRPVKSGSGAGSEAGRATPAPYVAGERKLLPLPVVLPRATEVLPPATAPAFRKQKPAEKEQSDTTHSETGAQESSSKNLISSVRSSQATARPRLVQVLNSQRRPILVSLPATALTTPPPSSVPASSTSEPTDRPFTPFSFPTLGTSRPSAPEPRGPINLYPRKLTTSPPPTTLPGATTTTASTTTTTLRPWPKVKVTLWPPARRHGAITRHPVLGPPLRPEGGVGGLAGLVQAAAAERHEASGTERLETLHPFSGEPDPQHALRHRLGPVEALPDFDAASPRTVREDVTIYYEQNSNGRVHIGDVSRVDSAPAREIMDAFIELKKV